MRLSTLVFLVVTFMVKKISADDEPSVTKTLWIEECNLDTELGVKCLNLESGETDLACLSGATQGDGGGSRCDGEDVVYIGEVELIAHQKRRIHITKDNFKPYVCDIEAWGWDENDYLIRWNFRRSIVEKQDGSLRERTDSPMQVNIVCDRFPDEDALE